jgi:ubiquinone/menaquinone biosynthesis C-methylase UbiE
LLRDGSPEQADDSSSARAAGAPSAGSRKVAEPEGLLFDHVAADYDRVRPGYPAPLVDEACSLAGLMPGSPVVEVGCGTGKLTVALAERDLHVEAVDPGREMVEIARRRVGAAPVRFHLGRFEDVELPEGEFGAVFAATAFHWVDPAVGWWKAARLLRPGGILALLAYIGGRSELDAEFLAAWRAVLPDAAGWYSRDDRTLWEGAEARRGNVSEVWTWLTRREVATAEAAELFDDVRISTVRIEKEETPDDALAFVRTTSSYLRLDATRRQVLERRLADAIARAGGAQLSTEHATLVSARVRAP